MIFKKTASLVVLMIAVCSLFATHFVPIWSGGTNDPFTLRVLTAKIGTTELQDLVPGDEIAVYDGVYCVGARTLTSVLLGNSSSYLDIVSSKQDDSPTRNGFISGNPVTVKIWSSVYNREIMLSSNNILVPSTLLPIANLNFVPLGRTNCRLTYLDATLPVELSAFNTAIMANNTVALSWVTQSENNLFGYHLYRGTENQIASADRITSSMIAPSNTSNEATYSYNDTEVTPATTYYYWLQSIESNGSSEYFGPYTVRTNDTNTTPSLPSITAISNAYPNPFNGTTHTNFDVDVKEGEVAQLSIYNIKGQIVKTYSSINPGNHKFMWNGKDANNNNCAAGIYFYKLSSPTYSSTKKMMYIK